MITKQECNKRIERYPFYASWENSYVGKDHICEEGEINYDGLSDTDKFILYVFAWNKSDVAPGKNGLIKKFGWTSYKVRKLFRELKPVGMEVVPTFNENDGMLAGRGYMFNGF